jgi:hypothetical protein
MAKQKNALFTAAPLFGRCIQLKIGAEVFDLKVMGERDDAAAIRARLLTALADLGITIEEVTR